ncbi:hypothetical protein GDO81_004536 [Engystomops pustulosus]|uniref:Uncharacterized protein n=1 Tax=Engystomops pustulosus TaxID=76066 RepID=A0AAV6ZY76_ENGPU|nr:hypothetical protein GDO81_004536 [Engystomops pustulosus]
MVSLLSRGVGLLVKSLAGLSCAQATRCNSLPGALSAIQCSATRWFSKQQSPDELPKRPLTSYLRFVVEQRPMLVRKYPGKCNASRPMEALVPLYAPIVYINKGLARRRLLRSQDCIITYSYIISIS